MAEAWSKTAGKTKSGWSASAAGAVNLADSLSPAFVPFAERWDAETARRSKLRTPENLRALMDAQRAHNSARSTAATAKAQLDAARTASGNPLSGARRAARTAHKAARAHRGQAAAALKTARANYPETLLRRAVELHAAHAVPAGVASYAMSTAQDWTTWPVLTSAAMVAANAGALWLGRRQAVTAEVDGVTAEERRLMERLDPTHWVQHAEERGLSGTLTTPPQVTPAGIMCGVRLDGKWTVKELAARADNVRALTGMRTETRMEITRGSAGGWARIIVRTRSASDGMSMIWTPTHTGIGVDEVTGDVVDIPLRPGVHVLLAGITGMGKSVSWRGLFLRAVLDPAWAPVVIDPKRQEAIGVQHAVRAVGQEPDREQRMADIYAMVQELTREMHRRQGSATGSTWVPDGRPENRCLLVIIDEGAALIRMARDKRYADVLDLLEELWAEARSVGFQFVWATQNPTKTGGVPALVKDNMSVRISLTTGAGEHERSIFGENAQQDGWTPSKLDGVPGRAMVQYGKRKPNPVRMWQITDDVIAALDRAEPWRTPGDAPAEAPAPTTPGARPALRLVKGEAPAVEVREELPALTEAEAAVVDALRAAGKPMRQAEIVTASGVSKGAVSKIVTRLAEAGLLAKTDGGVVLVAGEVSA